MSAFDFAVKFARRIPDPVFTEPGITRYVFMTPVRKVPRGLPLDPNARVPNVRRRVYQEVRRSLLNESGEPGTFHLKHKGITLVAERVERLSDDHYVVHLDTGHGILDGGHTYELITSHLDDENLPKEQFVKFEILTNIPRDWIVEIAGGLNTSVQVQPMSLDNLEGKFEWIKEELAGEPYFNEIAWRENEKGDYDARDIVALLTMFNVFSYPNDSDEQPIHAYERKSKALDEFEAHPDEYLRLRPILKDVLVLHDTIRYESREYWNESGGRFGGLKFVERRDRGVYVFPFIQKKGRARLTYGALYPLLAAFRWMVEIDPKTGNARWREGFDTVLHRWRESSSELLKMTAQASVELGRNPNAIGKSRNHWANLHARVAMRDLIANR